MDVRNIESKQYEANFVLNNISEIIYDYNVRRHRR